MAKKVTITPRKSEWEEVAQLLESDDFDSAEQMAKAVVKHAMEALLARDLYVIAARNDGMNLLYGPCPTETDALNRLRDESLGLSGQVGIFKLRSVSEQEARVAALDGGATHPGDPCRCGHPRGTHAWPGRGRDDCEGKRCTCKTFIRASGPA